MTDRYKALTVVLDKDERIDDAQPLIAAIQQMRGVAAVSGEVTDLDTHTAEMRVRNDIHAKLMAVL